MAVFRNPGNLLFNVCNNPTIIHLSSEGELKTGDRIVARQCHVVLVLVRQLPNLDCVVQHRPGDDGDGGDNNIPDGLISYSQFPLFRYSKVTCSR